MIQTTILGNPHSDSRPSAESTKLDAGARAALLRFVGADPDEYEVRAPRCNKAATTRRPRPPPPPQVVWTPNASGALKIVGESYPFDESTRVLIAPDVHNSVLGIGCLAQSKGASVSTFPFAPGSLCWDLDMVRASLLAGGREGGRRLLLVPGQSNTSGIKHPIDDVVATASLAGWDVLLDAAALAPSGGLDLTVAGR
jgi:Selenocysteine lyase